MCILPGWCQQNHFVNYFSLAIGRISNPQQLHENEIDTFRVNFFGCHDPSELCDVSHTPVSEATTNGKRAPLCTVTFVPVEAKIVLNN